MRVPSNRMRPRSPVTCSGQSSPRIVLAITAFIAAALLLVNVQPVVVTVVEGLVLLGWTVLILDARSLNRLASGRKAESICTFARSFDCRAVDTWVIRAVYETVQASLASDGFPIRASDRISDDLHLDDEDLDDLAEEIAERSCRTLSDSESNPYCGELATVRNLVLFFAHQGQSQPARVGPT